MPFEEGRKKTGGRTSGTKNKSQTLLSIDWTSDDIGEIKEAVMRLIKSDNPTVITKLLDKIIANKMPDVGVEQFEPPEFEDMPTKELTEWIKKNAES